MEPFDLSRWVGRIKARALLGASDLTLAKLITLGHVRVMKMPVGRPRYSVDDINTLLNQAVVEAGSDSNNTGSK